MYPVLTPVKVNDEYRSCADENPARPYWNGYACGGCFTSLGGIYFDGHRCVAKCPESYISIKVGYSSGYRCKTCLEID